jgi:PAS domain S-box-containing protein
VLGSQDDGRPVTRQLITPDSRRQAALVSGLALVILLACWWAAAQWYRDRLVGDERARALAQVDSIGTALTTAVNQRIAALDGLAAFVRSDPSEAALAARFDIFAGALYPTAGGIRAFQIFIGGTNRFDYPLAGNEAEVGRDIFQDERPIVREAVQRAVQTRRTTLSGPYELRQGGIGLVARHPVFFEDDFWGFAAIILEVPPILKDAGLEEEADIHHAGLSFALKDGLGQVFYGPPDVFADGPVTYTLELPEGSWELAGVPIGGWDEAVRRPLLFFEGAGLAIVGLLAGLTYLTTDRQARLALAVRERTREIEQINATLERQAALVDLAHDAILVRDAQSVITFWNPGAEQLYGWSRAEAVGTISHELLRTVFPESREAADAALHRQGRWDGELVHTQRNGERIYVSSRQALQQDEQGLPQAIVEINRDITEQKLAEGQLERRVGERTRELSALLELSRTAGSTLELRPLLAAILDRLKSIVDYRSAEIISFEGDEAVVIDYRGSLPRELVVGFHLHKGSELRELLDEVVRRREPVIVEDLGGESLLARDLSAAGAAIPSGAVGHDRAELAVPLVVRGNVIGLQTLLHSTPGYYTDRHAGLALAFAQQVAVAIENARLYEAARERAALGERQRLARGLHDSVSQVLYGIALNASAAEAVRERAPERLAELHHEVLALAEAGLAEMRALIFELRPESLEREGLVAALEKQAAAIQARHGIAVRAALGEEPELPLTTKEALYRIAQEALQNTVKHARPRTIELVLEQTAGELVLCVADDGAGFDPADEFPGHLGLHTMRERADGIGGTLELESAPGRGTRVRLTLLLPVPH